MSDSVARHIPQDFDPMRSDDPGEIHAMYRDLRQRCPVAHSDAYGGFWALTKHDDIRRAALDDSNYISSIKAVVPSDPRGLRRPPLNYDAPEHTPIRKALDRTLQRKRLERMEAELRTHAVRILEPMLERGEADIAQEFGAEFPAWATTEWLNLDPDSAPVLAETAARWVRAWREQDAGTVNAMSGRMYEMARALVADRKDSRRLAGEDPASSLLEMQESGAAVTDEEIVGALRQSLVVGMVAPPIIIGSIAEHLGRNAALQEQLRRDRSSIPAAIEEFLRLYAPYRGFARTVVTPTTIRGREVLPNEPIALTYASANRDEDVFSDPEAFILHRENIAEHLAFGRGRHRCPGAPLARMMLQITLEELLARTSAFRVIGAGEGARMPEIGMVSVRIAFEQSDAER